MGHELTDTLAIVAVHHKDDTLGVLVVVTPEWADLWEEWISTERL